MDEYVDFLFPLLFRATYRKFCATLLSRATFSLNVNLFTTLVYVVSHVRYNWNFSLRFTSLSLSMAKRDKWKAVFAKEILKTLARAYCYFARITNYRCKFYIYIYIYIFEKRLCLQRVQRKYFFKYISAQQMNDLLFKSRDFCTKYCYTIFTSFLKVTMFLNYEFNKFKMWKTLISTWFISVNFITIKMFLFFSQKKE